MATRPLYQPQLPHTVCGRLAAPQRGQVLRPGRVIFQAEARRLRLLAFEVFFLGTAMALLFVLDATGARTQLAAGVDVTP
jgi:hypothetical protein